MRPITEEIQNEIKERLARAINDIADDFEIEALDEFDDEINTIVDDIISDYHDDIIQAFKQRIHIEDIADEIDQWEFIDNYIEENIVF